MNITTPEERVANEIWFVINEIKSMILRLDVTDNLTVDAYKLLRTIPNHPFANVEDVGNVLDKLYKFGVFYECSSRSEDLMGGPILIYKFSVDIPSFEQVYNDYEFSFANTLFGDPITFSKPTDPRVDYVPEEKKLDRRLLEMIARKMGEIATGPQLVNFLLDCGVPEDLIEYPNTKWRMVNQVFQTLYFTGNPDDEVIVLKVIEESVHPIMHNADFEIARTYETELNDILLLAGYKMKDFKMNRLEEYKAFSKPKVKILQNGPLVLNLSQATLKLENETAEITVDSHEVKLLALFLSNIGKVLEYKEIARKLNLNVYNEKITNADVELRKAVNYKKRDLQNMLSRLLSKEKAETIMSLVKTQRNIGYKMMQFKTDIIKKSNKPKATSKKTSKK